MKRFCHPKKQIRVWAVAVSFVVVAAGSPVQAQPDSQLAQAKRIFLEAQALYLRGQYGKAAERFLAAFQAKPFAAFVYNAAVSFEKAKRYKEAIDAFGKYLKLSPKGKDARSIGKRIEALKKMLPPPPGLCNQDDDCDQGKVCRNGKCVQPPRPPPGTCTQDDHCAKGQHCKNGKCAAGPKPPARACKQNAECGKGEICKEGKCQPKPKPPGCRSDGECPKGKVCRGGRCKAPPRPAAPPLPPLKPKGLVVVDSKPRGATIWLDSKMKPSVGHTPFQTSLPEGTYTVIVEQKGYKPEKRKIEVRSDRLIDLYIALSREHYLGWLQVTSNIPGAEVYIDNMQLGAVGRTPYSGFRKPGMHTIWVRKPGYETARKIIEVVSGKTHNVHLLLQQVQYGWLRVSGAMTAGAKVKVDGKVVCKAPCKAVKVPAGGHILKVVRDGYKPVKKLIRVEKGKFTIVTTRLAKKPSRVSAWVTYGFAAASLAVAIFAVVKADAIKDDIDRDIRNGELVASNDKRFREGKIWTIVGDGLFGVTLIAAGVALYYTFRDTGPKSTAEIDVRGVSLVPVVGPGTVALSGRWRF